MKYFNTLIVLICFPLMSYAHNSVLLVPDEHISAAAYYKKCSLSGYECVSHFFLKQFENKETPLFNQLINNIDLTNQHFINMLPQFIQQIVSSEAISIEQAESLKELAYKSLAIKQQPALKILADQIDYITNRLKMNFAIHQIDQSYFKDDKTYYIVYKKILTEEDYKKLNLRLESTAVFKFSYNQTIQNRKDKPSYYLSGTCEKAKYSDELDASGKKLHYQPLFHKPCSLGESLNKSLTGVKTFAEKNKTAFILSSVIVGAFMLQSKYQVKLTF